MRSQYFKVHELVPKTLYEKYGDSAWRYVPKDLIHAIDTIKEVFPNGSITINNYYWKGNREWSGIRTGDSRYYSLGSQHSYGNAIDMVFSKYSVKEVRDYVLSNPQEFEGIMGLEVATWLHIDCRNEDEIVIFDAGNKMYTVEEALKSNIGE